MDNECHANICVFVQNSPNTPPPLRPLLIYRHIYRSNLCRSVWENYKTYRGD